jgi:hypothetical protein
VCVFIHVAGTIIEVNVSELGLVTPAGKVVWGKYAQVRHGSGVSSGVWLVRKQAGHEAGCIHHHSYSLIGLAKLSNP